MIDYIFSLLFNDRFTLRDQLLISYSVLVLVSAGVTLGICYGLLDALGTSSYNSADNIIESDIHSNLRNVADEISLSVDQQFRIVGESICMVSALYATKLLQSDIPTKNSKDSTIYRQKRSYRDYNFVESCTYPSCPTDYGALYGRSRFPKDSTVTEGSTKQSSVLLYSSEDDLQAQNDAEWQQIENTDTAVDAVVNLPYQDTDFDVMYNRGPNSTVMFYLSTQLQYASSKQYTVSHRTFPGIRKKTPKAYNPTSRGWFINASSLSYNMFGPYKETFTGLYVVTLSTRNSTTLKVQGSSSSSSVNIVAAAILLIDNLAKIINSISYNDNGYGALIKYQTNEVLVWHDNKDIYDSKTDKFYDVSHFDANLATYNLKQKSIIEYTDASGADWIVSTTPFFNTSYKDTGKSDYTLVLLVFSQKSQAMKPLNSLQTQIDGTTSDVTTRTIITIVVTAAVVLIVIFFLVLYIVKPFEVMRSTSKEIIRISTEEEDLKDYSTLVDDAYFNLTRTDEVGILAADYYDIVCLLHFKNIDKKDTPKYPLNPFHLSETEVRQIVASTTGSDQSEATRAVTSADLIKLMKVRELSIIQASEVFVPSLVPDAPPIKEMQLDVLSSFANSSSYQQVHSDQDDSHVQRYPEQLSSSDVEVGKTYHRDASNQYIAVDGQKTSLASKLTSIKKNIRNVGTLTSIKSQLYMLSALLLLGLAITMIVTVSSVHDQGQLWTDESGTNIEASQKINLRAIVASKQSYVKTYFEQLALDLRVAGTVFTQLLNDELARPDYSTNNQHILTSYSMQSDNRYAFKSSYSNAFSGYYIKTSKNCQNTADQCKADQNSNTTRLTSLFDLKMGSYFHNQSFISFLQFGLPDGYTRYMPYDKKSTYSNPDKCPIEDVTFSQCKVAYKSSSCSSGGNNFPPYDPTCRSWYHYAINEATKYQSTDTIYFQYPRISSVGKYVVTAVNNIESNGASPELLGVLISNYFVTTFQNSFNSLSILDSGYVFLIDKLNASNIIIHPKASKHCTQVKCAENLSPSEYRVFKDTVLNPIEDDDGTVATSYMKQGNKWWLDHATVKFEKNQYTLIAVVPYSEVIKSSTKTQDSINSTVETMIIVFVIVFAVLLVLFVLFVRKLISCIVDPVNDLRDLCNLIKNDDLEKDIPTESTSLDMKVLLSAFSRLMVALRFGSDSYARGDNGRARAVFKEALELFTSIDSKRGIGASMNNLAAVELSDGNYRLAEELYVKSIQNAEELITAEQNETAKTKLQRIRSDRKGNLAAVYLRENSYHQAFTILEEMLEGDKSSGYIRGCVVKQGTLGQYYLKQGELKSAERVFESCLTFVRSRNEALFDGHWNKEEAEAAEQIALYNMANLYAQQKLSPKLIEDALVEALYRPSSMHLQTTRNILTELIELLKKHARNNEKDELMQLAAKFSFELFDQKEKVKVSNAQKRIVFAIDYSGSMSGGKIRSAVENVRNIFTTYVNDHDHIGLLRFNDQTDLILGLTKKQDNIELISGRFNQLLSPTGSTRLYDAIEKSYKQFQGASSATNDWVIVLTDGEDNGSRTTVTALKSSINRSPVKLIVIGVGNDVQTDVLRGIASSASKGIYLFATEDKASITEAFGKVAQLIQEQILIEEY